MHDRRAEYRKYALVGAIGAAVLVLDQLSKSWIMQNFRLHEAVTVLPGLFDIVHARNTGAAFSMFADAPAWIRMPFFIAVAVVAGVALLGFLRDTPAHARVVLVGCALVLGGAVGNLVDRVRHGFVVDFLDFYVGDLHWPAFNVADSGITVGVAVLLLHSFLTRDAAASGRLGSESR